MSHSKSSSQSWAPAVAWSLIIVALLAIPLRLVSLGYLPPDDALRHAAKAVNGKTWQEILVMRPDITMDHNPGWHWILEFIHTSTGADAPLLVAFSVVSMFLVFALAPLPWMKRPEAWVAALIVVMLIFPYFTLRAFAGRPLFLSMGATLALLLIWRGKGFEQAPRATMAASTVLVALCVWAHGSWYLFALLPAVFFLAGEWRKGWLISGCWLAGTLTGAVMTGSPWTFLAQGVKIPLLALGQDAPVRSLAGELQPYSNGWPALILIAVVLGWRKISGKTLVSAMRDPIFLLAVLGWLLGFRVWRFWLDWGLPALALWLALEAQDSLESRMKPATWSRAALSGVMALLVFALVATDTNGRWRQTAELHCLDASRPEHAGWVPDPGGVLYSVNMSVFYQTLFTNPHGQWRYALGFEPSFMQPENLIVYQYLWQSLNALTALEPWVRKMTTADRLVLVAGPNPRPAFHQLEWYYAAENTWVGRLPRQRSPQATGDPESLPPRLTD